MSRRRQATSASSSSPETSLHELAVLSGYSSIADMQRAQPTLMPSSDRLSPEEINALRSTTASSSSSMTLGQVAAAAGSQSVAEYMETSPVALLSSSARPGNSLSDLMRSGRVVDMREPHLRDLAPTLAFPEHELERHQRLQERMQHQLRMSERLLNHLATMPGGAARNVADAPARQPFPLPRLGSDWNEGNAQEASDSGCKVELMLSNVVPGNWINAAVRVRADLRIERDEIACAYSGVLMTAEEYDALPFSRALATGVNVTGVFKDVDVWKAYVRCSIRSGEPAACRELVLVGFPDEIAPNIMAADKPGKRNDNVANCRLIYNSQELEALPDEKTGVWTRRMLVVEAVRALRGGEELFIDYDGPEAALVLRGEVGSFWDTRGKACDECGVDLVRNLASPGVKCCTPRERCTALVCYQCWPQARRDWRCIRHGGYYHRYDPVVPQLKQIAKSIEQAAALRLRAQLQPTYGDTYFFAANFTLPAPQAGGDDQLGPGRVHRRSMRMLRNQLLPLRLHDGSISSWRLDCVRANLTGSVLSLLVVRLPATIPSGTFSRELFDRYVALPTPEQGPLLRLLHQSLPETHVLEAAEMGRLHPKAEQTSDLKDEIDRLLYATVTWLLSRRRSRKPSSIYIRPDQWSAAQEELLAMQNYVRCRLEWRDVPPLALYDSSPAGGMQVWRGGEGDGGGAVVTVLPEEAGREGFDPQTNRLFVSRSWKVLVRQRVMAEVSASSSVLAGRQTLKAAVAADILQPLEAVRLRHELRETPMTPPQMAAARQAAASHPVHQHLTAHPPTNTYEDDEILNGMIGYPSL